MSSTTAIVICKDIAFSWHASSSGILLRYTGSAAKLIESGAIEPDMAAPRNRRNNKSRVDSRGHYFHCERRATVARGTYLHVNRWITDPEFARTLPGCPRLRFKDLDWLDAHPGRVLLRTALEKDCDRSPCKVVCGAGSYDCLAESGLFPEELLVPFKRKPSKSGKRWTHYQTRYYDELTRETKQKLGFSDCNFHWLMRGYFGIETWRPIEGEADLQSASAEATAEILKRFTREPGPTTNLRPLIDNTKGGTPHG
jgi:hypothetical protein